MTTNIWYRDDREAYFTNLFVECVKCGKIVSIDQAEKNDDRCPECSWNLTQSTEVANVLKNSDHVDQETLNQLILDARDDGILDAFFREVYKYNHRVIRRISNLGSPFGKGIGRFDYPSASSEQPIH